MDRFTKSALLQYNTDITHLSFSTIEGDFDKQVSWLNESFPDLSYLLAVSGKKVVKIDLPDTPVDITDLQDLQNTVSDMTIEQWNSFIKEVKKNDSKYIMNPIKKNFVLTRTINVQIKGNDSAQWRDFVYNGIKDDIMSIGSTVGENGITISMQSEYPEKHLDQILMLSHSYTIKAGHKIQEEEDLPIDPCEYGMEPW